MRIAVVGATGRIGAPLTKALLSAGHQVKALSRGGPALDALVALGAEPVIGSFDTGAGAIGELFHDADAAFLMVKTDWNDLHGHYPAAARRFVDALRDSPVKRAVSLTAIGSDVPGDTGHFAGFYQLDRILNQLEAIDLVHLRASWFMENLLMFTSAVARHGRIGWSLRPDVKVPWVATDDISSLAAQELSHPTGGHRVIREVGSQDLTMPEVATMVGRTVGRSVDYALVDRTRPEVEAAYLARGGTPERWIDDGETLDALNEGRVRFHGDRSPLPTTMEAFLRDVWKPRYLQSLSGESDPESFFTWSAQAPLAAR